MFRDQSIGFVGAGNMGEALISGFIAASLLPAERVFAYDVLPSRIEYLVKEFGIKGCAGIGELAESSSIIVLAVKPQVVSEVLDALRAHLAHKPLIISIAAGVALSTLESSLPSETAVVRVMPNTPALVRKAASALSRGQAVSAAQMEMSLALFGAVGKAVEVEEKMMDAVTGLSGSGPAYVLLVIEALIDAGVFMGLPRQSAKELVVQTLAGTSMLLEKTGRHPAELKDMITSPGGTTTYGLQVLESYSVRGAFMECVEAATKRSAELGRSKA
ncbi:MAG TPA: pyrroline-5-carboxylate reductase [Syntrophobacteraceae bacterium]|nr:pyrroline-5-carboxylate reductase [Syntrophobacteraceae bacterium]